MIDYENPRELRRYLQERYTGLKNIRDEVWGAITRELTDLYLPWASRFDATQTDRPKRNTKLINGRPSRAARTLAAGMQAGITSPARPWIRVLTPDPEMNEYQPFKVYLYQVQRALLQRFAKANFYPCSHRGYLNLGVFGTHAAFYDDDPEDILRVYSYAPGSYVLDSSSRWRINTAFREWQMTVGQIVEQFGYERASKRVQRAWDDSKYSTRAIVVHAVEPNRARQWRGDRPAYGYRGMAFKGCWFERDTDEDEDGGLLREEGYHDFPVVAYRWDNTGEDTYGYGPGLNAAGGAESVQRIESRKSKLVDKVTAPATQIPATLLRKRNSANLGAGEKVYLPRSSNAQKIEPIYVPQQGSLEWAFKYGEDFCEQVERDFYVDLFLMLARSDGQRTATEVLERHEEKMLMLGPVMERLTDEFLDPSVDRAYNQLLRAGQLPEAPPELEGMELRIEYISILTQAQKMLGASGMERFLAFAGQLAGVQAAAAQAPALRGIDYGEMLRQYGDILAVPPSIERDQREVEAENQQLEQQEAAARQGQAAIAAAGAAKDLAAAKLGDPSMLSELMGQQYGGHAGFSPSLPPPGQGR